MLDDIVKLLGDKADGLLQFKTPETSRERLHLPDHSFDDLGHVLVGQLAATETRLQGQTALKMRHRR